MPRKRTRRQTSTRLEVTGSPNSNGRLVLVVDDNFVNQNILCSVLHKMGLRTEVASDGAQALELFKQHGDRYSLILMDSLMPKMDGFEATESIREHETALLAGGHGRAPQPRVPIIAVTGIGSGENPLSNAAEHCLSCGMNDFIEKPIRMQQLRQKVFKWLLPTKRGSDAAAAAAARLHPSLAELCLRAVIPLLGSLRSLPAAVDLPLAERLLDGVAARCLPVDEHLLRLFAHLPLERLRLTPSPPWKANAFVRLLTELGGGRWTRSLQQLDLSHCAYLTNAGMQYVGRLERLVNLNLSHARLIGNEGVFRLVKLKRLATVDLRGCDLITDEGFHLLNSLDINLVLRDVDSEIRLHGDGDTASQRSE